MPCRTSLSTRFAGSGSRVRPICQIPVHASSCVFGLNRYSKGKQKARREAGLSVEKK
jgi:hypothetical protein